MQLPTMPSRPLAAPKRISLYLTLAALQFFVCEFLVAGTWRGAYSYSANFISDLGVPFCGVDGTAPCSSTAVIMNLSFIVLGVAYLISAALWHRMTDLPAISLVFLVLAGIGVITVGFAPSNTLWKLHSLGATLSLIFGSLFALTAALSLWSQRTGAAKYVTAALAVIGLVGYFCFTYQWNLGLGPGGIERVAVYATILAFVSSVRLIDQVSEGHTAGD